MIGQPAIVMSAALADPCAFGCEAEQRNEKHRGVCTIRIAHRLRNAEGAGLAIAFLVGIGMDGENPTLPRKVGVIVTFVTQLFLAGYAVGIALAVI